MRRAGTPRSVPTGGRAESAVQLQAVQPLGERLPRQTITTVSRAVMKGVADSGAINNDNMDVALHIMRTEIKAFFLDEAYADDRACIIAGSIHPGYVLASVVASCIVKIWEEQ